MAMGGAKIMWKYVKSLEYPVNIKKKDLRMAKYLVTQYGGANGELAAAFRYLNQRYTMPDDKGKALLTDIGTEELAHVEMISAMIYQLLNGATLKELKEAGLESHYAEHGYGLYPTDSNGVPFTVSYFATTMLAFSSNNSWSSAAHWATLTTAQFVIFDTTSPMTVFVKPIGLHAYCSPKLIISSVIKILLNCWNFSPHYHCYFFGDLTH